MQRDRWIYLGPTFVILAAALWGTETFFRVHLNEKFDSEVLVFHEHLICILFTLPFSLSSLGKITTVDRKAWVYLTLSGVLGSALGTTLFTLSLTLLNYSVANVLLNFQPIVTIMFATLLLQERLGRGFFIWGAIALACGAVIAANDVDISTFKFNRGYFYIALTAMAWGFSTVAGRGTMISMPLPIAALGRFVIGALALAVSLTIKGKLFSPEMHWDQLVTASVIKDYIGLSAFAGVAPIFLYFKGLSKTSASVGGFCELTQTFSALVLTWGWMHNPLSLKQVVAGLLLIVCVYMVNLNFAKANPKSP